MKPTRLRGPDIRLAEGCVVTAGKFESIHLGHQSLIGKTCRLAAQLGVPSAVLTFDPHPKKVLGDSFYQPLFTADERTHILHKLGVDYWLEYPFNAGFAATPPDVFCKILFEDLNACAVVVGEWYRFGYQRAGTAETLRQKAQLYGAQVHIMPHQSIDCSSKVSTSIIRERINRHAMEDAARMLGFAFFMLGRVRQGKQIGRTLGFPTVNIQPEAMKMLPPDGVYATRTWHNGQVYNSITNVGLRPTLHSANSPRTVESFLLDFDGDLYGAVLMTEFITFLRPERRFDSREALRAQIKADISGLLPPGAGIV